MLHVLLSHIPSTLLHIMTGMLMIDILFRGPLFSSRRKRKYLLLSGGAIVLLPDLPKLMGTIFFHSMLTIPLISLGLAFLYKKAIDQPVWIIWLKLTIVFFIGALFIDYLGNGVHLFYPVTDHVYSAPIIIHEAYYLPFAATFLYLQWKRRLN